MKEDEKISILLPTFNRADIISNCINSVLSQTYKNWELIIADDNSNDETGNLCENFSLIDDRVTYFKNPENFGLPKNRNKAIEMSIGSYVLFIEDDMILENNCLEILLKTFEELSKDNIKVGAVCPALVTNLSYQDDQRELLGFAKKDVDSKLINNPCIVDKKTGLIYRNFSPEFKNIVQIEDCHSCSLYSKEIFYNNHYEESAYKGNYIGEESEFHLKLSKKGYKLFFQPNAIMTHNVDMKGGCRLPFIQWSYYFARNHSIFILRNYGVKSLLMIPYFYIYIFNMVLKYIKIKK